MLICEIIWYILHDKLWILCNKQVEELRAVIGPLSGRSFMFCTDACLRRYLEAWNWNVDKSKKMLEETLEWRATYKPEEIRWVSSIQMFDLTPQSIYLHCFPDRFSLRLLPKVKPARSTERIFMIAREEVFLCWDQGDRFAIHVFIFLSYKETKKKKIWE